MLKSLMVQPRQPSAWAEHNKRVKANEAIHKELEATFPHKFRHPRIGRQWMATRDWRKEITPAITGHRRQSEPPITWQILLGVLIVVTFLGACYAL
ncbi:hypothetical protein [Staphylococcus aureus]|uniref:hypothetical protein n=1 Tax=Staphylococcus aureus TaxID=1280 RepID=UPI0012A09EF9|nr:hypothetical protein [Staphylococcus aureus]AYD82563.1 hypothetical protein ART_00094 [Achromobacter phage vB_Ade_ART]MBD4204904.1 hypothetical protein [Xanthomonas citri pv. citri]